MIHYIKGDILQSTAEALVNTVNLVGVMGKGVALQFKKAFPQNFTAYKNACKTGQIAVGKLFVYRESSILGDKVIINFPTKTHWRKSAEYEYVEKGLDDLLGVISAQGIESIAIPPLGAGNGGLNWIRVKSMIEEKLAGVSADVFVYEPGAEIAEQIKTERVKLTPARALLLYVLFDLVRHGEFVSEFSSEKICYFLQKFGASEYFNLMFEPRYYGPYSGKVRYVLNYLNGSYIMGYSSMSKGPFDQLSLIPDTYPEVKSFVENDPKLKEIAINTTTFLNGFYSDFGLELLSSVDYILSTFGRELSDAEVLEQLRAWSSRKGKLFSDMRHIKIARRRIMTHS